MIKVRKCRVVQGKKDPSATYYIAEVEDDQGNIALDVFLQQKAESGEFLQAEPYINTFNHKISFNLKPIRVK